MRVKAGAGEREKRRYGGRGGHGWCVHRIPAVDSLLRTVWTCGQRKPKPLNRVKEMIVMLKYFLPEPYRFTFSVHIYNYSYK